MHPTIPSTPNTEEFTPSVYRRMGVYAPFVWLAVWVIGLGQRAGFISPEFLMSPRPDFAPQVFRRNRQLRRARTSCLRRARRCARKHGKVNPENYTPRAYAHFAYLDRMDKTIRPAQFREYFIRDNDVSRVQVYGLDAAHNITGFMRGVFEALLGKVLHLSGLLNSSSLSLAAPADPAPP